MKIKKLNLATFAVAAMAFVLTSCGGGGGGGSVKTNEYFGDIPKMQSEICDKNQELEGFKELEVPSQNDYSKYAELEKEVKNLKTTVRSKIEEYFNTNKMEGKAIPFETTANVSDYKITSVKLDKVDGYGVILSVDFDLLNPTKKFLKNHEGFKTMFKAVDETGNALLVDKGRTYLSENFKKGEISNTSISFSFEQMCKLGNFAKIVAIDRDEYNKIRKELK